MNIKFGTTYTFSGTEINMHNLPKRLQKAVATRSIYQVFDTFNPDKEIGTVEAYDEEQAIARAKKEFNQASPIVMNREDWLELKHQRQLEQERERYQPRRRKYDA